MTTNLLASSNTLEGIKQCIGAYWYSPPESYTIDGETVINGNGKRIDGVRVVLKRGRYRFERVKL